MITPLPRTNFRWTKLSVVIVVVIIWAVLLAFCRAATITFGGSNGFNISAAPFGTTKIGTAAYLGEYQQIYTSSLFPSQSLITQIAFARTGTGNAVDVSYVLSIGFGLTTRTPASPGDGFETGATSVFSGSFVAHLTEIAGDWDLVIDLQTPFLYDPALGNLLLDVTTASASASDGTEIYFDRKEHTGDRARIQIDGISIVAWPNDGLATRFTVTLVPEPRTGALLLLGGAGCLRRRVRRSIASWIIAITSVVTFHSSAATITYGNIAASDSAPFGLAPSGAPAYLGRYQQIYYAGFFKAPQYITQIGFIDTTSPGVGDIGYKLSLGLGITSNPVGLPGNQFISGATTLVAPSVGGHPTPTTGDFDFVITLPTPFLYDPALGNLLLDVTIDNAESLGTSRSGLGVAFDNGSKVMGRILIVNGSVTGAGGQGLVTQFTVTPVPEPETGALLLLGGAGCLRRRVKDRDNSF